MTPGEELPSLALPEVLEPAISYLLRGIQVVVPEQLTRPTPCAGWDLRMLLSHVSESLEALIEGITRGAVGLAPAPAVACGAEITSVRARCTLLLAACTAPAGQHVTVGGHDTTRDILAYAGAVEIAVHGWDISVACGRPWPIPRGLAEALLHAAPLLMGAGARGGLFADPVPVPPWASAGDRLVAFLGRSPRQQWRPCSQPPAQSPSQQSSSQQPQGD